MNGALNRGASNGFGAREGPGRRFGGRLVAAAGADAGSKAGGDRRRRRRLQRRLASLQESEAEAGRHCGFDCRQWWRRSLQVCGRPIVTATAAARRSGGGGSGLGLVPLGPGVDAAVDGGSKQIRRRGARRRQAAAAAIEAFPRGDLPPLPCQIA